MDLPKKESENLVSVKIVKCKNSHKNDWGEFSNKKGKEFERQQKELAALCLAVPWTVPSEGIAQLYFTAQIQSTPLIPGDALRRPLKLSYLK